MESNNNPQTKVKKGPKLIVFIVVGIMLTMILGMQVFASVNGYGNIFFMIKNLVTTGTLEGDEVFSDKEITLSYKSIEIANGIKMQVNKLEIKDDKSTLYLNITRDENADEILPLFYTAGIDKPDGEGGYVPVVRLQVAEKVEGKTSRDSQYTDTVLVGGNLEGTETINLLVQDKKGNTLRLLEINLETREITVTGEEAATKISQIELKKYLNLFSELNNGSVEDAQLVNIAEKMLLQICNGYELPVGRDVVNDIIKEYYGDAAKFETVNGKEVLKNMKAKKVNEEDYYDSLTEESEYRTGLCLKINDIKLENGIYTVDYIYTLYQSAYVEDDEIENQPQYEATIKLKRNENAKYSKYQIVELSEGKTVKEKVNVDVKEEKEEKEEKSDYTVGDMCGTFNVSYIRNPNVKLDVPTVDVFGNEHVYIFFKNDGTFGTNVTGRASNGANEHDMVGTWKISGNNIILTYSKSDSEYNPKYNDVEVKFEIISKDKISREYGTYTVYFERNYDWTKNNNVVEEDTSSKTEDTVSNKKTSVEVSQTVTENTWKQVWPEWLGMKFKVPTEFKESESTYSTKEHTQMYDVTGVIENLKNEDVEIKITFINALEAGDMDLGPEDLDRKVESKDNKNWSYWNPVSNENPYVNKPLSVENGVIRRTYARKRGNDVEFVVFEIKAKGIDVQHYRFMNNVLQSISSTSV